MMDPELIVRPASPAGATGSNSPKTWSTSSIPKLDSLDESAPLDTAATKFLAKANANQRRESVGPGLPQIRRETNLILEEVKQRGRRKSWHSKLERKRRKGVIAPTSPPGMTPASNGGGEIHQRQKRPSWWNIFVPDHWPRSRRASQDVGHVALNSEVLGPWKRSKSRSVDHGFSAPFDLEALRSKVEGRFESVDKLTRDNDSIEKKKCEPPVNTITYTVGDRDTLTSVAARFDTTPSELTKLNRLATPFIFAGQVLRVPDRGNKVDANQESQASTPTESQHDNHDDLPPEEKELLDNLRPVSPKPGHIERVRTPLGSTSTTVDTEDEVAFKERFLKINVRHITDGQGVVSGVLLVTPNAVMFDPNVSDPLVIEHGPESYGVIAPMEFVVNAAIYYDIAHMRVGNRESSKTDIKPEIYHAASAHPSCGKCSPSGTADDTSLLVKDETLSELGANVDDADSVCSCTGERTERGGDAFPKAFERDLVTPTNLQQGDSTESESGITGVTNTQSSRSLEERRKSMLDHHWPIASKDRSLEETTAEDTPAQTPTASVLTINTVTEEDSSLVKLSCHDSGIDIRDPLPPIQPVPKKKTYSDAEIVLSSDWVPPITIAPTHVAGSTETGSSDSRKKTSSVSFSIDSNEQDSNTPAVGSDKEETEKQETKKNKMLKRLSYPLAWMETFAGSDEEKTPSSVPHSADGHHSSVFSKFISSSPINLVEFGTGLFLSKTPSEDSGGSGGPNSAGLIAAADACAFTDTAAPSTAATSQQALAANAASAYAGRSSVGTFIRNPSEGSSTGRSNKPQAPKLDYRSMVSVEDMPELFVSFDKLIPRPARSCEDPPLYLRLRMGKPLDRPIPRSTPLMSYGKKKMRPEYWFSVPRNRVDDLYHFLQLWVPQRYGELSDDEIRQRGFEPVDSDTELWDELTGEGMSGRASRSHSQDTDVAGELSRESWELIKAPYVKIYSILKTQTGSSDTDPTILGDEVLSRSEELRRALHGISTDSLGEVELTPPDLVGATEILTYEHREQLCRHLPARAEGYVWTLVFSTSQHGFSLNSMYRKMQKIESPILMVIEDTDNNVFGALTSCALKVSDHFYGTGESLLFRFAPHFQVYNWTGENMYFIKGNNESLSIGAGDGKFGIWLDGDLYQGRTETCNTYGNDPLTANEDFVVKTLECWAFI